MNKYRSDTCEQLTIKDKNKNVSLSGWINKKRDHGNLLFLDLRDNYGLTQCLIENKHPNFKEIEKLPLETVIKINGKVLERSKDTINKDLNTGEIEISIISYEVLGATKELPLPVFSDQEYAEEIRLKYRFLDLRRKKIHQNIILRSKVISFIRSEMEKLGFLEFQTPILTSSSPEGARDFLVPSRLNPGKFYALPQAPQQFKQLIMVSGFDKYFQIVVSGVDYKTFKPDPLLYTIAIKMLRENKKHVIAIEDSPSGVIAAENAGLICLGIKRPYTTLSSINKSLIFSSLNQINSKLVRQLA